MKNYLFSRQRRKCSNYDVAYFIRQRQINLLKEKIYTSVIEKGTYSTLEEVPVFYSKNTLSRLYFARNVLIAYVS